MQLRVVGLLLLLIITVIIIIIIIGKPKIGYKPLCEACTYRTIKDVGEITRDIGDHSSSTRPMWNRDIQSLEDEAPSLTHLQIQGIEWSTQLQRYVYSSQMVRMDKR